jgi:glucose-6-phosphate 1-dehydrogenase
MGNELVKGSGLSYAFILFGASGSLARLKIFPSLYELYHKERLPETFHLIGFGRKEISDDDFREIVRSSIKEHVEYCSDSVLDKFLSSVYYFSGRYDQRDSYEKLKIKLSGFEQGKSPVRLAYFSVPPAVFTSILENISAAGLGKDCDLRMILEKPFGYDYKSAHKLRELLLLHFKEEQYFLLDHYLGKEAVTNLLSLRYANTMISAILKKEYISNIQISAVEQVDTEGRAGYFDQVGVLRDMIQSHVLQILATATMRLPQHESAKAVRHEKIRLLKSLYFDDMKKSVVRGQYASYRSEQGVAPDSRTETFVALKIKIGLPEWKDVPVYLRSGKAFADKWTSLVVEFKPHCGKCSDANYPPNRLIIQLQPDHKIILHLLTKKGGETFDFNTLQTGNAILCEGDCLSEHGRLLLDVMLGKKDLFLDFEEIFASWKIIDQVQSLFADTNDSTVPVEMYEKGGWGPQASDELLKRDGYEWCSDSGCL